jgi:hypothetical protein
MALIQWRRMKHIEQQYQAAEQERESTKQQRQSAEKGRVASLLSLVSYYDSSGD